MTPKIHPALRGSAALTPVIRLLLALGALAVVLCFAEPDASAKAKTVALVVEGVDADAVRSDVASAVPHGTPIAEAGPFKAALAEQGVKAPLGRALDGAARDKTLSRVRKAAAATGVDATLIAQVTRTHKERHVKLVLVATSGAAGDLEDEVVLGARPSKDDQDKLASAVGTALVDYRAAPGDADKATASEKAAPAADEASASPPPDNAATASTDNQSPAGDTGSSASARPHGVVGHDFFSIDVGAGALGRHFGYTVAPTSSLNLRPYTVFPAAIVAVQAELYPLADAQGVVRDIGFIGAYSRSLFLQSTVDGGTIDTTATAFLGGVRWRTMPMGEGSLQLGISLSYALQSFAFGTINGMTPPALPSVNYQAIRPGVDVRVPVGKLSLLAQAGFRGVLSAGDVALRFRGTTTTGFDLGAGAAFVLATGWEVRAAAEYEGYFYSFNSQSSDLYRAQSAVDHLYGGRIAIAAIF
jgi:hypothetical protein